MLYSGCFVTAGNGRAVVTAVGDDTEFGKIARELRAANTGMTPLQEKLAKLGKVIAVVGSIVAALVFVLQVAGSWLPAPPRSTRFPRRSSPP